MQSQNTKTCTLLLFSVFTLALLLGSVSTSLAASGPTRIVVLPFYNEDGVDTRDGGQATIHYRRMMGFINNQLVRHDFEVINPFASDASAREYNRVQERAREDSSLAGLEMCKKYGTDAAYIVWLKVKPKKTADGYCKASARLDGVGYDSAGHDLGVTVSKTFKVTRRDCDDAIAEVEKEVGDLVGRKLTAWSGGGRTSLPSDSAPVATVPAMAQASAVTVTQHPETTGGALARNIKKHESLITVRLDGATDYEVVEAFGKVVNTVTGVIAAKRYSSRIVPDNPQASYVNWRLTIDGTDPFRLQTNIQKMLLDISDSGGTVQIKGVPYRYTAAEIDLLKGIRPGDATSREIQFVLDSELVRDSEMAGRHDAYKTRKEQKGFE